MFDPITDLSPIFIGAICLLEIPGRRKWLIATAAYLVAAVFTNSFKEHLYELFFVSGILFWIMIFSYKRERKIKTSTQEIL